MLVPSRNPPDPELFEHPENPMWALPCPAATEHQPYPRSVRGSLSATEGTGASGPSPADDDDDCN